MIRVLAQCIKVIATQVRIFVSVDFTHTKIYKW